MWIDFEALEFIFLIIISPAIIGFVAGFLKQSKWIHVLLVSLIVEIFYRC